jgi:hypothetical protein
MLNVLDPDIATASAPVLLGFIFGASVPEVNLDEFSLHDEIAMLSMQAKVREAEALAEKLFRNQKIATGKLRKRGAED